MAETTQLKTILADTSDDSRVQIMCEDAEENVYPMSIRLKGWDDAARKYVDDAEIMAQALENLEKMGTTLETIELDAMMGLEFEAYVTLEPEPRASFTPITSYVRFSQVTTAIAKAIKKEPMKLYESLPITEFEGHRFNLGVAFETDVGVVNLRVSQILVESDGPDEPDTVVGMKYENKQIRQFRDAVANNASMSDDAKASINARIGKLADVQREKKLEEISNVLGLDFEELIESGETLNLTLETNKIGDDGHYLVAYVAK